MPGELLIDEPADGIRRLTISNPSKRNALDHAILDAIAAAVSDPGDARCIVLTGEHGMFSSGYDIGDIPADVFAREAERLVAHPFTAAIDAIEACDLPAFVTVKSGLLGKHLKLVPLTGASAGREHLRVIFAKDDDDRRAPPGQALSG